MRSANLCATAHVYREPATRIPCPGQGSNGAVAIVRHTDPSFPFPDAKFALKLIFNLHGQVSKVLERGVFMPVF